MGKKRSYVRTPAVGLPSGDPQATSATPQQNPPLPRHLHLQLPRHLHRQPILRPRRRESHARASARSTDAHAEEDWIRSAKPPPAAAVSLEGQRPTLRVDDLVAPNANPIMRAAGPLLQLLGRLRVALLRASFASLMEQVAEAIKFFERDIRSAGVSEQQANNAKYLLCATADDIVQHIPTGRAPCLGAI